MITKKLIPHKDDFYGYAYYGSPPEPTIIFDYLKAEKEAMIRTIKKYEVFIDDLKLQNRLIQKQLEKANDDLSALERGYKILYDEEYEETQTKNKKRNKKEKRK